MHEVTADLDFNRFASEAGSGAETTTFSRSFRSGVNSRPSVWLGLSGIFSRDDTETDSVTGTFSTASQYADATATLYPLDGVRLYTTVGNRVFDDQAGRRSVDFTTLGVSLDRRLQEAVLLNLYGSTEVTGDVTCAVFRGSTRGDTGPVPIGTAIASARCLVLDDDGDLLFVQEVEDLDHLVRVVLPGLAHAVGARPGVPGGRHVRRPQAVGVGDRVGPGAAVLAGHGEGQQPRPVRSV